MGQYRPSGLIPSTLTPEYSIDATKDNIFSCKINGTSPTLKYRLKIMQNNTSSTVVYDTGVIALSTPLYPVGYDGTENTLEVTVPSTSGMQNGNEYKWTISSYWSDSDFFESFDNVFVANQTSSVAIAAFTSPITSKGYTFTTTITMASTVGVERFGWVVVNTTTGEELVNTIDSNNIYSSDVKLKYDGFLSGESYRVKVKCWFNDGTSSETPFSDVAVQYDTEKFDSVVTAKETKNSSVAIYWSNIFYVYGAPTNNNYAFENSWPWNEAFTPVYLRLDSGNTITYNQISGKALELPTTVTHTMAFYCSVDNTNIYRADGTDSTGNPYYIQVSQESGVVYLNVNGTKSAIYTLTDVDRWIVMSIQNNSILLKRYSGNLDGLYPSETLYPSDTLYPHDQTYSTHDIESVTNSIITDGVWTSFKFNGAALLKYFWIRATPLDSATWANLSDFNFIPEWDGDTRILATFQNTLSAGNATSSSNIAGWLVYRKDDDSSNLKYVRLNPPDRTYLVDYSVRNQIGVQYWVFPYFESQIGSPNVSNRVVPDWWEWDLIVADKYDNDRYYATALHRFDLNVTSGQLSNNTNVSVLNGFTPYSKVQHSRTNYWTGQLTALLGNCANEYYDTIEQMNAIKALTTDGRDKFLKDRKGNMWKVRLSSPVVENMTDEYTQQAVTLQLDWMEIGSASLSSITETLETDMDDIFNEPVERTGG